MNRLQRIVEHIVGLDPMGPQTLARPGAAQVTLDDQISNGAVAPALQDGFLELPEPFFLGVSSAAYQIEGAVAEGGRKPSLWDDFVHTPGKTTHGSTGDVACDHYHRFRDDIAIIARLGLKAYRFSISWCRIIPNGVGEVNEEGVQFYSDLIDELLKHGIEPWVTLYHWDLPSALESSMGQFWLSQKEFVTEAFGNYVRTCFRRFGGRVKNWITLNEPNICTLYGYVVGNQAPGRTEAADIEPLIAAHNMLLAHAEAVHIYRTEFAESQSGQIGVVIQCIWGNALDPDSAVDTKAAQAFRDVIIGWFADPIYFGDYNATMKTCFGSKLPMFTDKEKMLLRGSSDFFGLNYYFSSIVTPLPFYLRSILRLAGHFLARNLPNPPLHLLTDLAKGVSFTLFHSDPGWERADNGSGWPIAPSGLHKLLLYLHQRYAPSCGIVITENGCVLEPEASVALDREPGALVPQPFNRADPPHEDFEHETLQDEQRVRFLKAHLAAVHAARKEGADVRGYLCWSFLDCFEWDGGYSPRMGVVHVDYRTQKRTIKASGRFLSEVAKHRGFTAPNKKDQFAGRVM